MKLKISTTNSGRLLENSDWERQFFTQSILVTGIFIIIQAFLEVLLRDSLIFSPIVAFISGLSYILAIPFVKKTNHFSTFIKITYFLTLGVFSFRILTSAGINSGMSVWALLMMAYILFFSSLGFFILTGVITIVALTCLWLIQYLDLLGLNQYYPHYHPVLELTNVILGSAGLFFLCLFFSKFKDKAEDDLTQARSVAFHTAKLASLGEMAGGIAHEINNPLSILMGSAEVTIKRLEKGSINNQEIMEFTTKVKSTASRISKIVGSLRSLSRSEHDDPFIDINIETLIHSVTDLMTEKMADQQITFTIENSVGNKNLHCRPIQIEQILIQLINNAYDAVIESNGEKFIRVSVKNLPQDITQIIVEDSGPGVPQEIRDRIMDPFFTTKSPNKGTGLGLSLSAVIATDHRGRLYLSTNSKWTQFILELPNKTK